MRYAEVGNEEEEAVKVVREHDGAERARCDLFIKFSAVNRSNYDGWWRRSCRSKVRGGGYHVGCALS